MSFAIGRGLIAVLLLIAGLSARARADDAPQLDPTTPLVVLKAKGPGFANVRALPDPRSAVVQQVPSGAQSIRATGSVRLYGDTWWVEVQSNGVTGWLNARLLGRGAAGTPLQTPIAIDDLQPAGGYEFKGTVFREGPATSVDECARSCMTDSACVAIEYRGGPAMCRVFNQRTDIARAVGVVIAAKPVKAPPAGWLAQSAARFDRVVDQGADGDGYRIVVAHSADECGATCGLDARCAAFSFLRRHRLCVAYERVEKLSSRPDVDSGIRQAVTAPVDAASLIAALPDLKRAPPSKDAKFDVVAFNEAFHAMFNAAGEAATYATLDVDRQGRLTGALTEPALGGPMHASVMPRQLEGSLHNLAVTIGKTDRRIVHLAFYAGPTSPPVILASSAYASADAATAAAVKLQGDVDGLARQAGLGVDPLSLLKQLRR